MRIIVTIAQRAKTKNYLSCLCMVQCLENNYKRIFFGETEKKTTERRLRNNIRNRQRVFRLNIGSFNEIRMPSKVVCIILPCGKWLTIDQTNSQNAPLQTINMIYLKWFFSVFSFTFAKHFLRTCKILWFCKYETFEHRLRMISRQIYWYIFQGESFSGFFSLFGFGRPRVVVIELFHPEFEIRSDTMAPKRRTKKWSSDQPAFPDSFFNSRMILKPLAMGIPTHHLRSAVLRNGKKVKGVQEVKKMKKIKNAVNDLSPVICCRQNTLVIGSLISRIFLTHNFYSSFLPLIIFWNDAHKLCSQHELHTEYISEKTKRPNEHARQQQIAAHQHFQTNKSSHFKPQ